MERCHPSRARLAEAGGERDGVVAQTLRPSAREVVVAEPGLSGKERIGHPPFDERRKVPLDELGELVVRARPSSTFVGVGEAGRGASPGGGVTNLTDEGAGDASSSPMIVW